jgi:phosphoglycolate phosphatase-like HAD superfamily hydrolase
MTTRLASFIFDVEGTLVDCIPQLLACWTRVLHEQGFKVPKKSLAECSGMDPAEMLAKLLPDVSEGERKNLIARHGSEYRCDFLPTTKSFPAVRELLAELKRHEFGVALATTCDSSELAHYRQIISVDEMIDAAARGDEVDRGKPHPDLFRLALRRLHAECAWAIGDTPYDATSANRAGIKAIGTLTGGFSASQLLEAGCVAVFASPSELLKAVQSRPLDTWTV